MSELLRHPSQAYRDWVPLVFQDIDFTPIPDHLLDDFVVSGSERWLGGYDPVAGCHVDIVETIGMLAENEGVLPAHRLVACWDNGDDAEIDMDTGEILLGPEEDYSPQAVDQAHVRLRQALSAVEG